MTTKANVIFQVALLQLLKSVPHFRLLEVSQLLRFEQF